MKRPTPSFIYGLLVGFVIGVVAFGLAACSAPPRGQGSAALSAASSGINRSADVIDAETIAGQTVEPHATNIHDQTKLLRKQAKEIEAAQATIKKLQDALAKSEASRNSVVSRFVAFISVGSLIAVPILVFGLRSTRWAIVAAGIFLASIGAQFIIAWGIYIAYGLLAVGIGCGAWLLYTRGKALTDVVKWGEEIKPLITNVEVAKEKARQIQAPTTRKLVDSMRGATPPRKKPSPSSSSRIGPTQ